VLEVEDEEAEAEDTDGVEAEDTDGAEEEDMDNIKAILLVRILRQQWAQDKRDMRWKYIHSFESLEAAFLRDLLFPVLR
jgi:hypothetical protein